MEEKPAETPAATEENKPAEVKEENNADNTPEKPQEKQEEQTLPPDNNATEQKADEIFKIKQPEFVSKINVIGQIGELLPDGTYTVASDTKRYFVKGSTKLDEQYATDNTIKNINPDDPATYTVTISGDTAVYAGVKVTGTKWTEMAYINAENEAVDMTLDSTGYYAYAAMGATLKLENSNPANGVYNAVDGDYGKEVSTYVVTKDDVTFATGFKVTLGNGVTAEVGDEPVSNTTIVVTSGKTIDTLDVTEGTTIIKAPAGNAVFTANASDVVDDSDAINGNMTLVAATKITMTDGKIANLTYKTADDRTDTIQGPKGSNKDIYVLPTTVITVNGATTSTAGINITVTVAAGETAPELSNVSASTGGSLGATATFTVGDVDVTLSEK